MMWTFLLVSQQLLLPLQSLPYTLVLAGFCVGAIAGVRLWRALNVLVYILRFRLLSF